MKYFYSRANNNPYLYEIHGKHSKSCCEIAEYRCNDTLKHLSEGKIISSDRIGLPNKLSRPKAPKI